jgi:hypothetical protein
MPRKLEEPVRISSTVPIVVPAAKGEQSDGTRNFKRIVEKDEYGSLHHTDTQPIRELTTADAARVSEILGDEERILRGALDIKQGYEQGDEIQRARGFERVTGDEPGNKVSAFLGKHEAWSRVELPYIVTEALASTELVLWFSPRRQRFTPAFYCPDLKTALWVRYLIDMRACPHCGKFFVPAASNVLYCCGEHREAYRVSRAYKREKQKQLEMTTRKAKVRKHAKKH